MIDWIKNKLARMAIATSSIEKNLMSQNEFISTQTAIYADVNEGNMFKGLVNGEVTREVEMIRAQMYRIMEAADELSLNIVGYETGPDLETGEIVTIPIFKPTKKNRTSAVKRIKTDEFDNEHSLRYVINNQDLGLDSVEGFEDHDSKSNFSFEFTYNETPRFSLETHLKKINIREIDESESILEMYYNEFDDDYNVSSKNFTRNLLKLFDNDKKVDTITEFKEIGFITTNKDFGCGEMRGFMYKNPVFIRQLRFNGSIVVKYKVTNVMVEFPVADKYKNQELEQLYAEKAPRKKTGF